MRGSGGASSIQESLAGQALLGAALFRQIENRV
jgi:hypothetical protein